MEVLSGVQSGAVPDNPMPPVLQTYLCKEPWERSGALSPIDQSFFRFSDLERLRSSLDFYAQQDRGRTLEHLQLEIAKLHMRESQWEEAHHTLLALWRKCSWRRRGWWDLLSELDWALRDVAIRLADTKTLIAVEWELLNNVLPSRPIWDYDFPSSSGGYEVGDERRTLALSSESVSSCLSATFAFASSRGHVGMDLPFQIVIKSLAHKQAKPLDLRRIDIFFSRGLKNVRVLHESLVEPLPQKSKSILSVQYVKATRSLDSTNGLEDKRGNEKNSGAAFTEAELASGLEMPNGYSSGTADLCMTPGSTKCFSFGGLPREAGHVRLDKLVLHMHAKACPLAIIFSKKEHLQQDFLYTTYKKRTERLSHSRSTSTSIDILPKPPKLKLQIMNPPPMYYTGERMVCELMITNDEEEVVMGELSIAIKSLNGHDPLPDISWQHDSAGPDALDSAEESIRQSLGTLQTGQKRTMYFHTVAPTTRSQCIVDIEADYSLSSDTDTHIQKTLSLDPDFIDPFDPSLECCPAVHLASWPSIFQAPQDESLPSGLVQRYLMTTRLGPASTQDLLIESVELIPSNPRQDLRMSISELSLPSGLTDEDHRIFQIDAQKIDLDDRRTSHVALELHIQWRRSSKSSYSDNPISSMKVHAPHLALSFSEPRLLCYEPDHDGSSESSPKRDIIHLHYMLENPSLHLLTFSLTMEADEDFAFSGPKCTTLQLVPISRHEIKYKILPLRRGKWISPVLKVVDVNFNQTLKVHATGRLRQDEKKVGGVLLWIEESTD